MRTLTAVAIAAGTFISMATAAHVQFSGGVPGIEQAQAQVMQTPVEDNFKPLKNDWRQGNTPSQPADQNANDYVYTAEQVREIVGSISSSQQAPTLAVQQQIAADVDTAAPEIASSDCNIAISNSERKYGIPPYMLRAIALTESGRNGQPYPWAMNIQGRAYYAHNPEEIVSIVNQYGSRSSIDIGCSQINLKYHAGRFADWRSLIDPQTNTDYAAYHLLELRRELGSWSRAVGAYHSRTSWRGANYACAVSRNYGRILGDTRSGCGPDIELLAAHLIRNSA